MPGHAKCGPRAWTKCDHSILRLKSGFAQSRRQASWIKRGQSGQLAISINNRRLLRDNQPDCANGWRMLPPNRSHRSKAICVHNHCGGSSQHTLRLYITPSFRAGVEIAQVPQTPALYWVALLFRRAHSRPGLPHIDMLWHDGDTNYTRPPQLSGGNPCVELRDYFRAWSFSPLP